MSAPILKITAALSLLMTCAPVAAEDTASPDGVWVSDIIVSAPRLKGADSGQAVVNLHADDHGTARLDQVLASVPGVGLFRRADSLSAHPTTQGLNMRGVGANAAGRVLVTLDGVPMNDPFGGWVYWSGLSGVREITVMKGGSPGAYGAQALAGSVDLRTWPAQYTGGRAAVRYGTFDTLDMAGSYDHVFNGGSLSLSAGHFETDGFYLVPEGQRGVADVPAAHDADHAALRGRFEVGAQTTLYSTLSWYQESRVNGLAIATNETEALDASLRLLHETADGPSYELVAYYRTRDFANVFASVDDTRDTARPVLDQYDVPAWGAGFLARVQFDGLEFGLDARRMSGETNEHFRNLGAGFTRNRQAGGEQWTVGAYAEAKHEFEGGEISATVRLDRWRTYDGVLSETDIATGAVTRADDVVDRTGWQASGRLGIRKSLTGAIDLRLAAYRSWRLPTINEFYRPFRVGNDITEANADLTPETLYGIEAGLDYEPLNSVKLSATLYRNWLNDGVGNVTIGLGPGVFPPTGFVPAGGTQRQRANIDGSITDGLEVEGTFDAANGWSVTARYLYARARITAFDAMPDLIGNRPVQTPRHSLMGAFTYDDRDQWLLGVEARVSSGVYDDDQNTRRLDAIVTLGANVRYKLTDTVGLSVSATNLFDARILSALSADGLETLAGRRQVRAGLEVTF